MTDISEPAQPGSESRQHRRNTVLWAAMLDCGERPLECQVYNFSVGGAKLRVSEPVVRRSAVQLHGQRFGAFRARIVWQRDDWVGLSFLEAPDSVAQAVGKALPTLAA